MHSTTAWSGGFDYTQGSYLEGFEFTANSSISITKLGTYDSNLSTVDVAYENTGSETFATVPVALYDISTNKRLGKVKVSASDSPIGVYRYAALSSPITLNQTDTYAIVWISLSNYYIASPALVASDVNPAINYVAFAGYAPGGLTTTEKMVEPNWFSTESASVGRQLRPGTELHVHDVPLTGSADARWCVIVAMTLLILRFR
jgi:hypothetical protein